MRHLGHYISFGVNLAMFAGVCAFTLSQSKRRKRFPTHWLRYGPTYLVTLAALMIMADQTRHVLQDLQIWKSAASGWMPGSAMYMDDCDAKVVSVPIWNCSDASNAQCGTIACGNGHYRVENGTTCRSCDVEHGVCVESAESFACLSTVGWVFTVALTYGGFLIFFFASFWNANLVGKLKAIHSKWQALRHDDAEEGV